MMESLLNVLAVNMALNYVPHSAQLKSAVEHYLLQNVGVGVGLISNNQDSWQNIQFAFPIIVKSFEADINPPPLTGYILDLRYNQITQNTLNLLTRNGDTKYIAVTNQSNLNKNLQSLINLSLCLVQVIILYEEKIEISTLKDNCQGIGMPVSPTTTNRCKVNVSFMEFPPYIIVSGKTLSGYEGKMFQTTVDKMGFQVNYINRHEKEWGAFDPPSGLMGDVGTKTSLAGFGAIYGYYMRWLNTDFVYGCSTVHLTWAVAIRAGPTYPTWFLIFISEFSIEVWLCILLTYLILVIISHVLNIPNQNKPSWALYNLGLILGISQKNKQPKMFSIPIVLFGLLATSYYQTMMGTKLTVPPKPPEIDDFKTLSESGLLLYAPTTTMAILSTTAETGGEVSKMINNSYIPTELGMDEILPKIINKEAAFLRHRSNLLYLNDKNPNYAGKIHILKETLLKYMPVTMLNKHSCLTRDFQRSYSRLCETGLDLKWYRESTKSYTTSNKATPRKLAVTHIQGFLILLACGLSGSTIAFITELIFNSYKRKKSEAICHNI